MSLESFIHAMPKVELHVHLEGSIRPETLLELSRRNDIALPADSLEGLRQWYVFTDFPHFVDVYLALSRCIRSGDDLELITREFLQGQAAQNVLHSEVTYTALTQYRQAGLSFDTQLAAINRARAWAAKELGVSMLLIIDIPRDLVSEAEANTVADWAIGGLGDGVGALGLAGYEVGFPPEDFAATFARAAAAGLPAVVHAGETLGAASIWGAVRALNAVRIGHGVRCLEDPDLVEVLRARQIPLEVCPSSNVCLQVVPSLAEHPLPRLREAGLLVTLNTDDPPMFNTTLTGEYLKVAEAFDLPPGAIEELVLNAAGATLLPEPARQELELRLGGELRRLRVEHGVTPAPAPG